MRSEGTERVTVAEPTPRLLNPEHTMNRLHSRSPRIGLILPYTDLYLAGGTPHWSDLMAQARLAEDVGFDSVWVPDHLLFRFPGTNSGRSLGLLVPACGPGRGHRPRCPRPDRDLHRIPQPRTAGQDR